MNIDLLPHVVNLAKAYFEQHNVERNDVPALVQEFYKALDNADARPAAPVELSPAVPVKKSVTPDYIICLDDGKKFKSLKRHLTVLGMSPEEYREKWGLPRDYPMVAPGYSAKRSELAKASGLGQHRDA